jgi:hypothetical protein
MANSPSAVDLNLTYAEQTAVNVSNGTYSDVITTLKVDSPGDVAAALDIPESGGQLWSNFVDDYIRATWNSLQGQEVLSVQTTDATPDVSNILTTLTVDGDSAWISLRVQAKTGSAAEVVSGNLSGMVYRTGGSILIMDPGKNISNVGLAGVDIGVDILGDDVRLEITGIGATVIQWTIYVTDVKEVVGP